MSETKTLEQRLREETGPDRMVEAKSDRPHVQFQVWWVPQIPMGSFDYDVPSIEAGKLLLDALGKYDAFQFKHNVKGDYSNCGSLRWRLVGQSEDDWTDIDTDDDDEIEMAREDIDAALSKAEAK